MPPLQRRLDRGRQVAGQTLERLGTELRIARTSAGLSQASLARMAGLSQAMVSRLERARVPAASVSVFVTLFAILGHSLTVRAYPDGSPARDEGHARLIGRFASLLPPSITLRTEVPLRRPGDLRAWDGELLAGSERCKLEAEMVISDVQALDRRVGLKMEDDGVDRVILVVADTRRNREVLRAHGALLRSRFPLRTSDVLTDLRAGRCPSASGIVLV
jgi:transcriptional regulator with XRE-family HTH domain